LHRWNLLAAPPKNRNGPTRRYLGDHIFYRVCDENGIVHKFTKPYDPWANGQAERMNRTVKDAGVVQKVPFPGNTWKSIEL